jgi:hypothetical protein
MVLVWRADTKDTLPADNINVFCSSDIWLSSHTECTGYNIYLLVMLYLVIVGKQIEYNRMLLFLLLFVHNYDHVYFSCGYHINYFILVGTSVNMNIIILLTVVWSFLLLMLIPCWILCYSYHFCWISLASWFFYCSYLLLQLLYMKWTLKCGISNYSHGLYILLFLLSLFVPILFGIAIHLFSFAFAI